MNAHLAHASGRGYVFSDYVWAGHHYPWSFSDKEKSQRQWPPHTPLNALMSGPVTGGSWDVDDTTPRSISTAWFDVVCPHEERRYVNTSDLKQGMGDEPGDRIVAKWADFLRTAPERCIDIVPSSDDGFPQIFDIWLWGNTRLLPLWNSFSSSPVSRLLAASPIVKAAVDRNEYLFLPRTPRPAVKAGASPYDRVLSLHIRRGDYEGACKHFATWSSTFYGWNQLEFLPDRFIPPPGAGWGTNTPENFEIYMRRCLPSIEEVVGKIRHARDAYDGGDLDVVYILTNEKGEWLDQLMDLLMNDGWSSVRTSKDLVLESVEQKEVAMAIDMDIARRAGVFIGNGVSSSCGSFFVHGTDLAVTVVLLHEQYSASPLGRRKEPIECSVLLILIKYCDGIETVRRRDSISKSTRLDGHLQDAAVTVLLYERMTVVAVNAGLLGLLMMFVVEGQEVC